MVKVKKHKRTKKKYSKRKYLNKAKTNRRYSKNKYTRRKHTRRKNTRRKHKKKLRGGMDEEDQAGVVAESDLWASAMQDSGVFFDQADMVEEARAPAEAAKAKVEEAPEAEPELQPEEEEEDEFFDAVENYTDWYIKISAADSEKKGHRTTDDLQPVNGLVIKYVENLTGEHQSTFANALVMGQQVMGADVATEQFGYYENGNIYETILNSEGKRVKNEEDETGKSFDEDFKNRYHIKVVNEGFKIITDFLNRQYVITFEDDPYNPLVLEFDTFSGEGLTIDKYVTPRTMDLYRISMNIGETPFYSDIRWSSFEELVADCMEAKDTPSFEPYSNLDGCQKQIEEIGAHLKAKRTEYTQIMVGAAKGMYRMGAGVVGWAMGASDSAASGASDDYDLEGKVVDASDLTKLDNPSFGDAAVRKFMIVSIARLIKCGFLSIVYKHLKLPPKRDQRPGEKGGDKSLVVAGEGSNQLGFFGGALQLAKTPTELALQLQTPADLAIKTLEKGKNVVTYAGAAAGQVAQNIFTRMASEEWVHLQQEVSKELLYERMCSFGKGFDQQVMEAVGHLANATSRFSKTTGYGRGEVDKAQAKLDEIKAELKEIQKSGAATEDEMESITERLTAAERELEAAEQASLSSVAGMVGKAAGNYGNAKQAVNIAKTAADWWTSLNPSTAAAKAGTAIAWKGVNLAYYVQKVKNNGNRAQKPAEDLWKSLCLLLAECELDDDDDSNDIIKSQRVLNIFEDYERPQGDPKKLNMDAVLASPAATGHPGADVIRKFLKQQRQGGPQPGPQPAGEPEGLIEDK